MNKKNIPVITDREKLYDKCENMEQLFDKYYLPLLDKHYSKTYKLQQENKQLKDNWNKLKQIIDVKMYNSEYLINLCGYKVDVDTLEILKIIKEEMQELEQGSDKE